MASVISLWGGLALAQNNNAPETPQAKNTPQAQTPAPLRLLLKCFLEQTAEPSKEQDPTVIMTVKYDFGAWSIVRSTQSGKSVPRSDAYVIKDITKGMSLAWEGFLPKAPTQRMTGRMSAFGNGNYIYAERLFDTRRSGVAANLFKSCCIVICRFF
jgi:hypothetical protein